MIASVVGIAEAVSERVIGDPFELALNAADRALLDAGLSREDVDGVLSYGLYGDLVPAEAVAFGLGRDEIRLALDFHLGGQAPAALVGMAAHFIMTGNAKVIVISRGMCGRTGTRVGSADFPRLGQDLRRAAGVTAYPITAALWARRYLETAGLSDEALAEAVLHARATGWPDTDGSETAGAPLDLGARALPDSLEDYLSSPLIASPLRRYDCVSEIDAGAAVIVVSEDIAARSKATPLRVAGSLWRSRKTDTDMGSVLAYDDLSRNIAWAVRRGLEDELRVTAADCDVVSVYDCFSSVLLQSIEGLGLCGFGEAPGYLRRRREQEWAAPLINPGGGMLNRGYLHGMNNILDSVRALRGLLHNGAAEVRGLALSGGMTSASAVLLTST